MSGQKLAIPAVSTVSSAPAAAVSSILPVVGGVILLVGVVAVTASLMNRISRKWEEEERQAKLRMQEDERRREKVREEEQLREQQQKALQQARERIAEAARLMARWQAPEPFSSPTPRSPVAPAGSATINRSPVRSNQRIMDKDEIRRRLADISAALQTLPREFTSQRAPVYANMKDYHDRLTNRLNTQNPPSFQELDSFRETVARTLHSALTELEAQKQKEMAWRLRANTLMDSIVLALHMASEPLLRERLFAQHEALLKLMAAETANPLDLELVENAFKKLAMEVLNASARAAAGEEAAVRLTAHLTGLGYSFAEPFALSPGSRMQRALLYIPGGEMLRAAIHPDNKLSFQVLRRVDNEQEPATLEDLQRYRRQELRWSRDFQELIRLMREDGFSYDTALAEFAAEKDIAVVVRESAEDIEHAVSVGEEEAERFSAPPLRRRGDNV